MKLRTVIILLIVAGVIGLIVYRAATSSDQQQLPSIEDVRRSDGVPVDVTTVQRGAFERWRKMTGTLEGISQAPIYANMPVRVRRVHVKQGQKVGAGSVIITLDPLSTSQTYSARERARLQYETLKKDYERLVPLHKAGAVSDSQFDQARMAMASAKAALRDFNSSLVLTSPLAGVVTDVRVRAGDLANPTETLAVVARLEKANLKLHVSQRDVREIKVGQRVEVLYENGNEGPTGEVSRVSLSADPKSRLFLVEITIDSKGLLPPGTMQRVKIRTERLDDVLLVPVRALLIERDKTEVFVIADGKAEKREIQIGNQNNDYAHVKSGLEQGNQVVVWGINLLAGGEKVQIHKVVEDI